MEEEGETESVITEPAAAGFALYQGGVCWLVQWPGAKATFPLKQTGLPG